jgi:D-alanine-D-alanine ligase
MSLTVHHVLGLLTYSRSDFIVTDDDEVYFLEVNTLPGMTPTSLVPQEAAAVGITYEEVCQYIVDDAMKRTQVK